MTSAFVLAAALAAPLAGVPASGAAAEGRGVQPAAAPVEARSDERGRAPSGGHEATAVSDVLAEAEHWLGARNMTGKGGSWCAHFASYVLERTGHAPLANGLASSALAYGRRLAQPKVGALAVVTTRVGYAAHVGFVSGVNPDGSIELVSGN